MEKCPATETPEQFDGDENGLTTFIAVSLSIGCNGRVRIKMTSPNLICFPCPNTIIKEHKIVQETDTWDLFHLWILGRFINFNDCKTTFPNAFMRFKCNFHFLRSSDIMALVYPPSRVGFHCRNSTVAIIFTGLWIREIVALKLHSVSFLHGLETQEKLSVMIAFSERRKNLVMDGSSILITLSIAHNHTTYQETLSALRAPNLKR